MMVKAVITLLLLIFVETIAAHEALDEQIEQATAAIKHHPHTVELLIKRGRLRLEQGDIPAAIHDFLHVLEMEPKNVAVYDYLAEAYLSQKKLTQALRQANLFMQHVNNDGARARGFELLGRIQMQAHQFSHAAQSYRHLIRLTHTPKPDYYLVLANAYIRSNNNDNKSALQALDEGLNRLGLLPVLQKRAIDIELRANNADRAIKRVDTLIVANPHSFAFLKLKADILWREKRFSEAKSVYQNSLVVLDKLPPSRKSSPAVKELRTEMTTRLR